MPNTLKVTGLAANLEFDKLAAFANLAGNDKIHAKSGPNGSVILYSSNKTGTGLKNFLFGTDAKRQAKAKAAMDRVFASVPTPAGQPANALTTVLLNLRQQLPAGEVHGDDLRTMVAAAKVEIANAQQADLLQKAQASTSLPAGMRIDAQGVISGTSVLKTSVENNKPQTLSDAFATKAGVSLASTTTVGGVTIAAHAKDDMVRMDLHIQGYGNTQGPPGGSGTPEMNRKQVENAQALRNLAGSDEAATVLSACCVQHVLRVFERGIDGGAGKIGLVPVNRGVVGGHSFVDGQGVLTDVGSPTQYAGAKFNLTKEGTGDFRLKVQWDYFAMGCREFPNAQATIQLMPDHRVFKATFDIDVRIDGKAAAAGELKVSFPTDPTVTYDGKI